MKKIIPIIALFLLLLASCQHSMKVSGQEDLSADSVPEELIPWENLPYYMDSTASYIDCMYGMIGAFDKTDHIDSTYFPKIPGLYFKSCMEACQEDYCKSERAVLAISCSEEEGLLDWVSKKACEFANECIGDSSEFITPNLSLHSIKDICDYYIDIAKRDFGNYVKDCIHEGPAPCEQRGRLVAKVWQKNTLNTFIVYDWYDMLSSGNNIAVSYVTVDELTGKEIGYSDLIGREDEEKMAELLLRYLWNGSELWVNNTENNTNDTGMGLLSKMDGCALLNEGLCIYYHPYTIGSGAEGEFIAIIPYEVLKAKGVTLKNKK